MDGQAEINWRTSRVDALNDAVDVLTALDFIPCGYRGAFEECPKCGLLARVLTRLDDELQLEFQRQMFDALEKAGVQPIDLPATHPGPADG